MGKQILNYPTLFASPFGVQATPAFSGAGGLSSDKAKQLTAAISKYYSIVDEKSLKVITNSLLQGVPITPSQLLRMANPNATITGVDIRLQSMERDLPGKNHSSSPIKTDPFMVSTNFEKDFDDIRAIAITWMTAITNDWVKRGLPLTDKSIGNETVKVPDTELLITKAASTYAGQFTDHKRYATIAEQVADFDALARMAFQRYVRPFWYIRKYAGSSANVTSIQTAVLSEMIKGLKRNYLTRNKEWSELLAKTSSPQGTNTGWPLYIATHGTADAKELILALVSETGKIVQAPNDRKKLSYAEVESWAKKFSLNASKFKKGVDELPPFTVQPGRRFKFNRNPVPSFEERPNGNFTGMLTGVPDQRLIYMFSYIANMITHDAATVVQQLTMATPGMEHDAESMLKYTPQLRKCALGKSWIIENDASGFDSNISFAHQLALAKALSDITSDIMSPEVTYRAIMLTRTAPLVIPDPHASNDSPTGLLLKQPTGLQSGSIWTKPIGTLMTKWMNLTAYLNLGWIKLSDIADHMAGTPLPNNRLQLISGDDNSHLLHALPDLNLLSQELQKVYQGFAIKADLELSDRLLMRHIRNGRNTPVLGRVFVQRASNENLSSDQWTSSMGWLSSLEGAPGIIDTPHAKARESAGVITAPPLDYDLEYYRVQLTAIRALLAKFQTSVVPIPSASVIANHLDGLLKSSAIPTTPSAAWTAESLRVSHMIAKIQLSGRSALEVYLLSLIKDQASPTVANQLASLLAISPEAQALYKKLTAEATRLHQVTLRELGFR